MSRVSAHYREHSENRDNGKTILAVNNRCSGREYNMHVQVLRIVYLNICTVKDLCLWLVHCGCIEDFQLCLRTINNWLFTLYSLNAEFFLCLWFLGTSFKVLHHSTVLRYCTCAMQIVIWVSIGCQYQNGRSYIITVDEQSPSEGRHQGARIAIGTH